MFWVIFCIAIFFKNAHACPPSNEIAPCTCQNLLSSDIMTCAKMFNPEDLEKPLAAVAKRPPSIEVLAIVNSSLLYIPSSIFKNTNIQKIHFIDSEIMSLSDTDTAFEGLENSLIEIRASQSSYIAHWDWEQLANLKALELIDVVNIHMGSISTPFPKLKNLKFLGITNAEISFIVKYAFANLKSLEVLNLKANNISDINRNMFPEPAKDLFSIDLSFNNLSYLPADMFRNMPRLEQLILDNNKFTTLFERKAFSWALKHLYELGMHGNKFECDCRIKWMAGARGPIVFTGVCNSPAELKGRPLRLLEQSDVKC